MIDAGFQAIKDVPDLNGEERLQLERDKVAV
jgi:hypothetical protein